VFRAVVTAGFLLLSVVLIWISYHEGTEVFAGDLLMNLATEIMGIVLTVAIVDWFFERRRMASRARQMAWSSLHGIEHSVWVWLGGPRQMETEEILGLLSSVQGDDPLPEFTQNLMLSLGTRAKQAMKDDPQAVRSIPGLGDAFEHLSRLSSIRDGLDVYPPRKVAEILASATSHLALVLGLSDERIPGRLIRYRDPSLEGQEQRHFGVGRMDGRDGDQFRRGHASSADL
jgi:hypothetical protein